MLKAFKDNKGQSVMGEYLLVFFIVVGMLSAMSVYFKRGVQGRLQDGYTFMIKEVINRTDGAYNGPIYYAYEPYYTNTASNVLRTSKRETWLRPDPGGSTGIYGQDINDKTKIDSISETAPPKDAD